MQRLDRSVQELVLALEQGHNTVAQLLANHGETILARLDYIDNNFQSYAQATEDSVAYQRLLGSLFFPEIESREEQIQEAFEGTCRWIFDSSANEQSTNRPWSNFRRWLEADNGMYWISGKPGSGKSTLMKYIVKEDLTAQLLGGWESGTSLIVLSFFFWNAGTTLQKSYEGLLRSLLHQIAEQWPELTNLMDERKGRVRGETAVSETLHTLSKWTDQRLLSLLNRFLDQKPNSVSVCAFIDGLDEFVGDEDVLLDMIRRFSEKSQCKMCVSSRPEQALRQEFRMCPQLRVQDLNRADIERTANVKLIPILKRHKNMHLKSDDAAWLVDTLIRKASGVFLWLDLMIKDLIRGSKNGDTVGELQSRLERTPDTINGMYAHMLRSLDPLYEKEAVEYFGVLIAAIDLDMNITLLNLACADGEPWKHIVQNELHHFNTSHFGSICQNSEDRLNSRCCGFIEIQDYGERQEDQDTTAVTNHARRVDFVHRTAMDFVRGELKVPLHQSSSSAKAAFRLARSQIGTLALIPLTHPNEQSCGWDGLVSSNTGRSFRLAMTAVSNSGNSTAVADCGGFSQLVQIDLTDQAFNSVQNLYIFHGSLKYGFISERDFFQDTTFLRHLLRLDSVIPADWATWCQMSNRVSIAAFFGCHHYVQSRISTRMLSAEKTAAILQAALAGFEYSQQRTKWSQHSVTPLPRFFTIQEILKHDVNLNTASLFLPNTGPGIMHGTTLWGNFFVVILRTWCEDWRRSPHGIRLTWMTCYTDLLLRLLALGANPNTRLSLKCHCMEPGHDPSTIFLEASPLRLLDWIDPEIAPFLYTVGERLESVGGFRHGRFRFILSKRAYYPVSDSQSQRLEEAMCFTTARAGTTWCLYTEVGTWFLVEHSGEVLKEVLPNITAGDTIDKEMVRMAIEQPKELF